MAKYVQPNFIVDSSASFLKNVTFDSSVYLQGVTHISNPAITAETAAKVLMVDSIGVDVAIKYIQLGTMATETKTDYETKANIESSLGLIDAKLLVHDTSIGINQVELLVHDTSIGLNQVKLVNVDTSLGTIWTKFDYVDISLNNIESGSGISQAYVDGSISTAVNAVDTSLVTYTDAVIITALDSSFALYETKINLDTSLNDKANLNTVIDVKETTYIVAADNNHVIDASGTWTLTFPDNLDTGFQVTAVNAGVGVITLDASKLLTKDSAVTIVDQYAGISAVHKGNGIYYCWGGLT